jgi:hypothetical protein
MSPVNAGFILLARLPSPWGLLNVSLCFMAPGLTIVALGGALSVAISLCLC